MQQQFHLDPQAQAVLDRARASVIPPLSSLPPAQARTVYRAGRLPTQPSAPPDVHSRDFQLEVPAGHALPVREYRPVGQEAEVLLPALVFFHGGGWVVGDRDTHDVLCRMLCHHGEVALARLHGPVGLRLGAKTPAEIAVSIVAELVQVKNKGASDAMNPPLTGSEGQSEWEIQSCPI